MEEFKKIFVKISDRLLKVLGGICAAVMAALTLSVLWGVGTRYLFGAQASFTEELARMLLIVSTFFGGAYAFGTGAHIGLDFLASRMEKSARGLCLAIARVASILFCVLVLSIGGIMLVDTSMQSGNRLVSMPIYMWEIYLCVPISGVLATIFLLSDFMRESKKDNRQEEIL